MRKANRNNHGKREEKRKKRKEKAWYTDRDQRSQASCQGRVRSTVQLSLDKMASGTISAFFFAQY